MVLDYTFLQHMMRGLLVGNVAFAIVKTVLLIASVLDVALHLGLEHVLEKDLPDFIIHCTLNRPFPGSIPKGARIFHS